MSPLIKRLPRELVHNIGKYLGIFLLMAVSIALTSGFLLAAHSISVIIDDMPETYVIEDGRFTTAFEVTDEQLDAVRDAASDSGGIELYKNYSFDTSFEKTQGDNARNCTVRTFEHRTQVDLAAYAQGGEPQAADEIAIDRVFATNNDVSMGDTVALNGVEFRVVGIMTLADNQALFQSNSDFTVNTLSFGVAEVSSEGFKALENTGFLPSYTYSYRFADRDLSVADRVDIEKDMVSALSDAHANVTDLTDVDSNQGIGYAKDDVSGDSAMWMTLLYIIIVIMAFVFVVLTSGMIEEESAIIGTLLASGYRRRELVAHYLALPCKFETAKKVLAGLNEGHRVLTLGLSDEELASIKDLCLLTCKPMLYIANVDEDQLNAELPEIDGQIPVPICAKTEADLAELDPEDAKMFMEELGLSESGLARLIRSAYALLGLQSYFTSGETETRAWTIPVGAKAPQAAGVIHSDFERGFIKAETASFEDYVSLGGEKGCRDAGKLRQEGKEYVVQDGDVMHFKFNV